MRGSVQEMKVIYFKTYTLVWFIRKLIAFFFLLNICFYRFSPNNGTHGKSKRRDIKGTVSINLGDYNMKMYSPYGPLYPVPVANPIKVRLNRIIYLPT